VPHLNQRSRCNLGSYRKKLSCVLSIIGRNNPTRKISLQGDATSVRLIPIDGFLILKQSLMALGVSLLNIRLFTLFTGILHLEIFDFNGVDKALYSRLFDYLVQ